MGLPWITKNCAAAGEEANSASQSEAAQEHTRTRAPWPARRAERSADTRIRRRAPRTKTPGSHPGPRCPGLRSDRGSSGERSQRLARHARRDAPRARRARRERRDAPAQRQARARQTRAKACTRYPRSFVQQSPKRGPASCSSFSRKQAMAEKTTRSMRSRCRASAPSSNHRQSCPRTPTSSTYARVSGLSLQQHAPGAHSHSSAPRTATPSGDPLRDVRQILELSLRGRVILGGAIMEVLRDRRQRPTHASSGAARAREPAATSGSTSDSAARTTSRSRSRRRPRQGAKRRPRRSPSRRREDRRRDERRAKRRPRRSPRRRRKEQRRDERRPADKGTQARRHRLHVQGIGSPRRNNRGKAGTSDNQAHARHRTVRDASVNPKPVQVCEMPASTDNDRRCQRQPQTSASTQKTSRSTATNNRYEQHTKQRPNGHESAREIHRPFPARHSESKGIRGSRTRRTEVGGKREPFRKAML